jgi:co-chaperonin GroES (HSP10)
MYVFDISWVDQRSRTYYLADRSNATVDIVDTKTGTLAAQLQGGFKGFTGSNATSGPNGVTTGGHCLFVTDAPSRVVSFKTSSFPPTFVNAVSTASGDLNRADELAFDPMDGLILAINNADDPPFGTFIKVDPSTCGLTQPAVAPPGVTTPDRIIFNAANGVDAQNGAEQPQWDPATRRFYLSIPQIGANVANGGIVRIDPATHKIDHTFPISLCQPAGLSKGPRNDFLVGCNTVFDTAGGLWSVTDANTAAPIQVILNVSTGNVHQVEGVGVGDEVWFNSGDGNYYTASSTSPLRPLDLSPPADAQGAAILGVIDAKDQNLIQLVPTFNVPAVTGVGAHPASTAHSVAADARNNNIFVPLGANNVYPGCLTGCIAVFFRPSKVE